ncbi:MAG: hypothetical protein J6T65_02740 [Clostridia bacterium]|nr:hypothetical protein [Clostridia bacterium]
MKSKFVQGLKKFIFYAVGIILIAIGINCSKLSSLGISPVSSVPRACEVIWGWSLGAMTIVVYCILVLLQIIVLRKRFKWINLLGIPIAVAFGFLVDLFGVSTKTNFFGLDTSGFGHWLAWLPVPENYLMRMAYFVASLIIIAVGVFLYLRPKWVAMPAEGFAAAIAEVSGAKFGNCKTIVDTSMITISFIMHFVFMVFIKGLPVLEFFKGFIGLKMDTDAYPFAVVVVGIGTVLSAILIGQLVKLLTKLMGAKIDKFLAK